MHNNIPILYFGCDPGLLSFGENMPTATFYTGWVCKADDSQACFEDADFPGDHYCCPGFCPDPAKTPVDLHRDQ
jgi:hypothetical protein